MNFRKTEFGFLLKLELGEKIKDSIETFAKKEGIESAAFFGIGAAKNADLGFYLLKTKEYQNKTIKDEFEVASCSGNLSIFQSKPSAHIHIVLSDNKFQTTGGHLNEATVTGTLEVMMFPDKKFLERKFDSSTGLNLLNLN